MGKDAEILLSSYDLFKIKNRNKYQIWYLITNLIINN